MPLNLRIDKENGYIYTMEYCSVVKKNEILKFACTWIQLENTILTEVTHTQKDEYGMYSLISEDKGCGKGLLLTVGRV